jgi:hypothetical protein
MGSGGTTTTQVSDADPRTGARVRRPGGALAAGVVVLVAATTLTGCASLSPDASAAVDAVESFHAAVAAGEGSAACDLLAPAATEELEQAQAAPCPDAVLAADLTPGGEAVESHAYGRQAQVVLTDDVVFLTVSGGRWLVTAAGCTPRPERPYDCEISEG